MNDLGDPGSITSPIPAASLPQGLVLPAYGGPCLSSLVPALLEPPGERAGWLPPGLNRARQVALLVLDGLGWDQLQERRHLVPVLAGMAGGPISSVAPTTTAVALCSLTLGMTPAAHGVLGYKLAVAGPDGPDVLNVLRWTTRSGNARQSVPPGQFQPRPAFRGRGVPVVTRAEFRGSGFSEAHQSGGRELPWVVSSSLPLIVRRELAQGEQLVYAYYDGIDRIAHAAGLGELYEAELSFVDSLVSGLVSVLPSGAALAVVSDHGQVEVGQKAEALSCAVMAEASMVSGEGRFRWLHARPGRATALLEVARQQYGEDAWVATREEVVAAGVFGGRPSDEHLARLGDVALIPLARNAYMDPGDQGEARLVGRHGGLSEEEVLVPLLVATG